MTLDANIIHYLATPYTRYPDGIWPAYREAARIAGRLADQGLAVFSPIAHTHPLAIYADLDPLNHAMWMRFDAPFMVMCGGLIVATMDGWRASVGVTAEIDAFKVAGKPIYYVDPATLVIAATSEEAAS